MCGHVCGMGQVGVCIDATSYLQSTSSVRVLHFYLDRIHLRRCS